MKLTTISARASFEIEGYVSMTLDEKEFEEFKSLSEDEQLEWLGEMGTAVIDDYDMEGFPSMEYLQGPLLDIEITQ